MRPALLARRGAGGIRLGPARCSAPGTASASLAVPAAFRARLGLHHFRRRLRLRRIQQAGAKRAVSALARLGRGRLCRRRALAPAYLHVEERRPHLARAGAELFGREFEDPLRQGLVFLGHDEEQLPAQSLCGAASPARVVGEEPRRQLEGLGQLREGRQELRPGLGRPLQLRELVQVLRHASTAAWVQRSDLLQARRSERTDDLVHLTP
mmetsp:Transcript_90865/g.234616  ORF Transcript_90865/g.234616 Transcript_90865/m.234616 type:complete len:210 (-) Transcript_90865:948-1577(-)